jgi:hypothetical protein
LYFILRFIFNDIVNIKEEEVLQNFQNIIDAGKEKQLIIEKVNQVKVENFKILQYPKTDLKNLEINKEANQNEEKEHQNQKTGNPPQNPKPTPPNQKTATVPQVIFPTKTFTQITPFHSSPNLDSKKHLKKTTTLTKIIGKKLKESDQNPDQIFFTISK